MADTEQPDVTTLTVQLLSAYFANNTVASTDIAELVRATKVALLEDVTPGTARSDEPAYTPAVSVRKSLSSPDHILSLIDGKPYKALKRHLARHDLTPQAYRERYGLATDYPMVAPSFAAKRRAIAEKIGLGRRAAPAVSPADSPTPTVTPEASPQNGSAEAPPAKAAGSKASRSGTGAAVPKGKVKGVAGKTASQIAPARASEVSTKPKVQKSTARTSGAAAKRGADGEPSSASEANAKSPTRARRGTLKLFPEKREPSKNSGRKPAASKAGGENVETGTMPAPEGSQSSKGRNRKPATSSSET